MKYIFIFLFFGFFISTQFSNAQTEKGNWSLGIATTFGASGSNSILGFGYTVNEADDLQGQTEIFQFNFAPRIGYVLRKDFSVGLDLIVTYFNSTSTRNTSTFVGAGPFARYYFKGNYLRPFIEVQGSYGNANIKSESSFFGNQDFNVRYLLAGGAIGLAFPIKNILHIDLGAAYNKRFGKFVDDDIEDNSYSIGLKVGGTVFLQRTKAIQN